MAQFQAAALRKTGLRARIYYCVFGLASALYIYLFSLQNISISYAAFKALFSYEGYYLTLQGRQVLQETTLLYASIFMSWYVLTGTRYSPIKLPDWISSFKDTPFFLLLVYYTCLINFQNVHDYMGEKGLPIGILIGAFFLLIPVFEFLEKLLSPIIPKAFYRMILPLMFALTPFADLMDGFIVWWVLKVVLVPFLIFAWPVYWLAAWEYIKEHPEYRKIFVFGRGGAARWGGIYSFIKYDFNALMSYMTVKNAPIYCGQSLWYDDIKLGGRHIGLDSDSMMLTVASMGGGKSLYSAWNTLLLWNGGAFVLDPKGEHFQRTYAQRQGGSKQTHILDPWGLCAHIDKQRAGFNPLEEIDITSLNAKDDIALSRECPKNHGGCDCACL